MKMTGGHGARLAAWYNRRVVQALGTRKQTFQPVAEVVAKCRVMPAGRSSALDQLLEHRVANTVDGFSIQGARSLQLYA